MTQPSVCAIMLTAKREQMARQAVECFRKQTYEGYKTLLVVSSGTAPIFEETEYLREPCFIGLDSFMIGEKRNFGNSYASCHYVESFKRPDILVHWDDDDLSHPNRIAEQVELLQSTGADVVGYNRMLFWADRRIQVNLDAPSPSAEVGVALEQPAIGRGQAWIYTGEILGTSLCYWRKTWERTPFKANHVLNEDGGFISEVRGKRGTVVAVDSIRQEWQQCSKFAFPDGPRMIARIHAGNTKNHAYNPEQMASHPSHWTRVPEWDDYCRRTCEA